MTLLNVFHKTLLRQRSNSYFVGALFKLFIKIFLNTRFSANEFFTSNSGKFSHVHKQMNKIYVPFRRRMGAKQQRQPIHELVVFIRRTPLSIL